MGDCGAASGIVAKFDGDEIHDFVKARDWADRRFPEMAFTPEQVVAAAVAKFQPAGPYDETGIYFLIRDGRICYIGKANELARRIYQHRKQGRPFDSVAVIAGIHWEFAGALEAAYVTAWEPPWNIAPVYGTGRAATLGKRLAEMDRALVCTLPEHSYNTSADDLADRL